MRAHLPSPQSSRSDLDEKTDIASAGLQISSLVLKTLQDAAQFAPVPYLQNAATLALSILNMVETTKGNRAAFKAVANDACELVCVVVKAVRVGQERGTIDEESDLMRNVRQLIDTLTSIDNFTRKEARRNVVTRFVRHQSDLDKIDEYRRRLQRSLDIFGLQSNISISDNLSRVIKQQDELIASKKAQTYPLPSPPLASAHNSQRAQSSPLGYSSDSPSSPSGATYSESPVALSPPSGGPPNHFTRSHSSLSSANPGPPTRPHDPFGFGASFAHFHPGANVKWTSVGGDMNQTDNSNNISNVNSGNTTTTTITDAYNSGSYDRLGARGNRAARRNYY